MNTYHSWIGRVKEQTSTTTRSLTRAAPAACYSLTVSAPAADIDEQGVDLTVIRWFLSLTVEERLAHADEWREASFRMMQAFDEQHRTNPRPAR